jgi:hypothetical protein
MKNRDAVLCYQEAQSSDKSSKTIDLDIVDPVSALGFEFEARNGTTNNQNNPLSKCIEKLELVDGADVLASMNFEQAQALQFYKTGKQPQLRIDEQPSSAPNYYGDVIGCMILFGRKLWDREYALDLTKFRNPKLKITWDLGHTRDVDAATAFATGTLKISAWAKVMEGMGGAPGKFLMDKEIESWTGATSGDKPHELPLDYVYRMLMLQTYLAGNDIDENISKLKLTADTDKFIAFERYVKQLDAELAQQFGNVIVWKRAHYCHGDTVWVPINKEPQVRFVVPTVNYLASYGWCWSGRFAALLGDTAAGTVSADTRVDLLIEGHALHATLPVPMGIMDEPDSWFDPTPYKRLDLVCTEAAAAANSIVAEQVRPN